MGKRVKIAVVNDTHCLSSIALCPSHQISLPDGGYYSPSKSQKWLWQCWEDYWQRVADIPADKLIIVSNGDATDGDHHDTPQLISRDLTVQMQILQDTWAVPLDLKPDAIYVINGTECHVGKGGSSEKGWAASMEAEGYPVRRDPSVDLPTWWRCKFEVQGVLLDFLHQGRTGGRSWTFNNAANLLAKDIVLGHVERGQRPPSIAFRAHYHRWNDSFSATITRVVINGCWQFGSFYVKQRLPEHPPGYGGSIVVIEDGEYEIEKVEFTPKEPLPCQE